VYRVDALKHPRRIDFVGFDELTGVQVGPASLIRTAKLTYEDGHTETVLVPLLYGLTWSYGSDADRAARMTRFLLHLDEMEAGQRWASGTGVGQQDLSIRRQDGGGSLFGLGSVSEIVFPLDLLDPRFDEKARARGIDPDDARRQMGLDNALWRRRCLTAGHARAYSSPLLVQRSRSDSSCIFAVPRSVPSHATCSATLCGQ
jgi:hypothetical protein